MFVFSVTMTEEERQTELWEDAGLPGWHRLPLHGLWVSLLCVASLGLKSHPQPRRRFPEATHPLPEPMPLPAARAGPGRGRVRNGAGFHPQAGNEPRPASSYFPRQPRSTDPRDQAPVTTEQAEKGPGFRPATNNCKPPRSAGSRPLSRLGWVPCPRYKAQHLCHGASGGHLTRWGQTVHASGEIRRVPGKGRLPATPKGWEWPSFPQVPSCTTPWPFPSPAGIAPKDSGHLLCSDGYSLVGR